MSDDESAVIEPAKRLGIPYASRANRILVMQRDQGLRVLVPEAFAREDRPERPTVHRRHGRRRAVEARPGP